MKFSELELDPRLYKAIAEKSFSECTPIQEKAIPEIIMGRDISGLAQTGTGKTGAFLIPLISRILASQTANAAATPPDSPAYANGRASQPQSPPSEELPKTSPEASQQTSQPASQPVSQEASIEGLAEASPVAAAVPETLTAPLSPAVSHETHLQEVQVKTVTDETDPVVEKPVAEEEGKIVPFSNWRRGNFVLILVPTRELAEQVNENARALNKHTQLKTVVMYGGVGYDGQKEALRQSPQFVVATPGRLIDLYKEHFVDLKQVRAVVFDEADRMFDMGFKDDMKYILQRIPQDRQFLVFSATLNFDVLNTAYRFGANPVEINLSRDQAKAENVEDKIFHVGNSEKPQHLLSLLKSANPTQAIVFTNFKNSVERIAEFLALNGYKAHALSSLLNQAKRNKVITQFKTATEPMVLVATDVAARGLDIQGVDLVINYELPGDCESYVHRIGRTGRAGNTGNAFSFVSDKDVDALSRIEDFLKHKVPTDYLEDTQLIKDFKPMPKETYMHQQNDFRASGNDGRSGGGPGDGRGGGGRTGGTGGGGQRRGRRGGRGRDFRPEGRGPVGEGATQGTPGAGEGGQGAQRSQARGPSQGGQQREPGAPGQGQRRGGRSGQSQRGRNDSRPQQGGQARHHHPRRDSRGPAGRTGQSSAVAKASWSDKVVRIVMNFFSKFKGTKKKP